MKAMPHEGLRSSLGPLLEETIAQLITACCGRCHSPKEWQKLVRRGWNESAGDRINGWMAGGEAEHMGTFIRHDQITEKLEIARTMGLVADFSIIPTGSPRRPDAAIRVSPGARTSNEALRTYLARLLQGLVADHEIIVVQPFVQETAPALKTHDAAFANTEVSAAA